MKIVYVPKDFNAEHLKLIEKADEIIEEYERQGFVLTLRQLYYQFVARVLLANRDQNYKRLGNIISDARRAGMISWTAIEDRTRFIRKQPSWENPEDIVKACASQFNFDMWKNQKSRVEVWIEKDALLGVIEDRCRELDVPFFSCRGYSSDSEMWRAGRRHIEYAKKFGQPTLILHMGDHDPSGIDMTRDIQERLALFGPKRATVVERIALTMEQVEEFNPPPNPAKTTDARFADYESKYGDESWELDALDPATMNALIQEKVEEIRDQDAWDEMVELRDRARKDLGLVAERWAEVEKFVREDDED